MKILFLLLCIISFSSYADLWKKLDNLKIINFSKLYLNSEDYHRVLVVSEKGEHILSITDYKNKVIYERSRANVFSSFKSIRMIYTKGTKPTIMIVWQKGVHGEQVELIDSGTMKVKLEKTSSWPVEILNKNDGTELVFYGESLNKNPQEFKKEGLLLNRKGEIVQLTK
jgi:hypothetical protein